MQLDITKLLIVPYLIFSLDMPTFYFLKIVVNRTSTQISQNFFPKNSSKSKKNLNYRQNSFYFYQFFNTIEKRDEFRYRNIDIVLFLGVR